MQAVEIKEKPKHAIVNDRTEGPVLAALLAQFDKELEDTEWILNKLKAESSHRFGELVHCVC